MEKANDKLKSLFRIAVICLAICAVFWLVSKATNVGNVFSLLFGHKSIDVYAFDGADTNTNGGLTRTEIDSQKANDDCPTIPDINDVIYIQDYNDFVCFYKKTADSNGKTIYPNIVFVKTADGLKFNGALNIIGHAYYGWFGMGYSYKVEQKIYEKPVYINQRVVQNGWSRTNLFLVSTGAEDYMITEGFNGVITTIVNAVKFQEERIKQTQEFVIKNAYPYFLKFYNDNVEIIQDRDNPDGDFNFFYDYLYRSASEYDYGTNNNGEKLTYGTCAVDVTNLTVYPLPDDLRDTYPIPNTDPTEYFGIYKTNVFITCNYEKFDITSPYKDDEDLIKFVDDDPITYRQIDTTSLCDISATLMPTTSYYNNVITNAVRDNPVVITFYDSDGLEYRKIEFTDSSFTSAVGSRKSAFAKGSYTYDILSNQLIFNSYSGSLSITESGNVKFNYTYLDGKVLANFSLVPTSSDVDYSDIDLATYPVRIILNNEDRTQTYQFVFDAQAKVSETQSTLLLIGRYSYTILSEKLVFGSNTGSIDIKPRTRDFEFAFGVVYNRSDLAFSVTVSEEANSSNGSFRLSGDSASVQLLGSKLNLQNYYVNITLFDANGHLVETLNHTHNGNGTCSGSWTLNNLIAGNRYTAQMTYANGTDISANGYIEYQSSTFSFDYKDSTRYTFTYSCREVA